MPTPAPGHTYQHKNEWGPCRHKQGGNTAACTAEASQGYTGPENSARCHVRTWYLSSQGPQGGSWGGGHAPARQGALTAAIAATPARFYHSKHLQHTTISSTHAGGHAHTCGWGPGMPPWEVGRGQMQRRGGLNGKSASVEKSEMVSRVAPACW